MVEEKIKFYFPTKILKSEDYAPVESLILKDYYRNSFLKLIDKVRELKKYLYNKDRKKQFQKIIYRLL